MQQEKSITLQPSTTMFSKQQIEAGLELAKAWYEGWKLEDLESEQLIEAIEKAPNV